MISLIVAIANNQLIGKGNDLPWHYPQDLAYFKRITHGKTVLMGEATFHSILDRINKPLPGRKNIVATLDKSFDYPGVEVIYDLFTFLKKDHEEEIFIIGGKQIYTLALPYVERLYITHINKDFDGDVYFPSINYKDYTLISKQDEAELSFCVYEKVK